VDPVERAAQTRRQRIGDLDELPRVRGLGEVAMLHVAVAEVIAELDIGGRVKQRSSSCWGDVPGRLVDGGVAVE